MKKAQKHFVIKPPRLDARTLKALLPYIAIALLATKLGQAYRMTSGADALDRLGRDYESIIREWKEITRDIGCDIVALDNEALFDSRKFKEMGDIGRMLEDQLLAVLAYVADVERKKTLERQKQGIAAAKTAGVKFGRPISISDWELFDRTAKRWVAGEISAAEACRITGAKKTSWYKYTKERGFSKEK